MWVKERNPMMMPFIIVFGQIVTKMIGAVSFIRILLVKAGVERNPGPVKQQFIFRYQYLLLDVGTEVTQKLFDDVIGTSVSNYLAANVKANQKLQFLMTSGKITKAQQAFLPPIDKNPISSNFDITLLTCLLRNICGLRHFNDAVWTTPAQTDLSIEADITRLRECRNQVAHMHTVYMSDADLTIKWIELTKILKRLNSCHSNGITDLSTKVNEAENMDIDENLRDHYNTIVDQWREMERLYDHGIEDLKVKMDDIEQGLSRLKVTTDNLQQGQTNLKQELSTLKKSQSDIKDTHSEIKDAQSDIKDTQSKIKDQQSEIKNAQSEIKDAQSEIKDTHSEIKHEQSEIKGAQSEIKDAQSAIKDTHSEIKHKQSEIKGAQSEIKDAQSAIKDTHSEIKHEQSEIKDAQFEIKDAQSAIKYTHSEIKHEQSEIKHEQSEIKDAQSVFKRNLLELQHDQSQLKEDVHRDQENYQKEQEKIRHAHEATNLENEKDLKNRLMKMYKEECCTLPVLPLCEKDEDEVDLLSFYQPPSLTEVRYHRSEENENLNPLPSHDEDLTFSYVNRYLKHLMRTLVEEGVGASKSYTRSIIDFEYIFSNNDPRLRNIFITGDAGVGKSSFCNYVSLLWYKSQCNEKHDGKKTQKNIDFMITEIHSVYIRVMINFDFVFFVNLRDTDRTDVISMIIEQVYTETECDGKMRELYKLVEDILKHYQCLVILDGLDEWNPKSSRKKDCMLPDKITAEKCKFLVTCRPYKIETVRLSRNDIDVQLHMTGIQGESAERYVIKIVNRCNKANGENKDPKDFIREVKKCGLYNQLCIPIIGSQLVAIWFDFELTCMSRALIYSHIVEMLFERAEKRNIRLPSAASCNIQLPESFSDLVYFQNHVSFSAKICLLSFRSLFKLDKCASVLVYTRKQLLSEPYFLSIEEMDFLCKIGILSRNKVIGRLGKQEQKLSYLHKSYLEYFAALFVSSFDDSACNAFDTVVKEWNSINDVLQYQNFFIFLFGFSYEKANIFFESIYLRISEDLNYCRTNTIFSFDSRDRFACRSQLVSLQRLVLNCFQQPCELRNPNISLRLADFIFDENYSEDKSDVIGDVPWSVETPQTLGSDSKMPEQFNSNDQSLKRLLLLNRTRVFSLHSIFGQYSREFDEVTNLHVLYVGASPYYVYNNKFTDCMLRNKSTLHTVYIKGVRPLMPELPLRSLHCLTSLSLSCLKMSHDNLHDLFKYLSENVLMENIHLFDLTCVNHKYRYYNCTSTLDLSNHTKLVSLYVWFVNILCTNINNTSLKHVKLHPFCQGIAKLYNMPVYE